MRIYPDGDRPVSALRLMLVDECRTFAVVTHPRHQILKPGAAGCRERIARVAEIVEMESGSYEEDGRCIGDTGV
jgi:hypothetical protein